MNRRKFLLGSALATLFVGIPTAVKTRLNLAVTGLSDFPAQPWLTDVKYVGAGSGAFYVEGNLLYRHRIDYQVLGTRWKRAFLIAKPLMPPHVAGGSAIQGTKPIIIVGMPGSNSYGDGAMDLMTPPNGDVNKQWLAWAVLDGNCYGLAVDGPLFGSYPYEPTNPIDPLVDDLCAVQAAKYFIRELPAFRTYGIQPASLNVIVGGISWGGIRASFLGPALNDCMGIYVAGTHLSKEYDLRPWCSPSDWGDGFDYVDMLLSAKSPSIRAMFGGNGNDYLYTPFSTGNPMDRLKEYQPPQEPDGAWPSTRWVPNADFELGRLTADPRATKIISPGLGHEIDLPDIRAYMLARVNEAMNALPEYQVA